MGKSLFLSSDVLLEYNLSGIERDRLEVVIDDYTEEQVNTLNSTIQRALNERVPFMSLAPAWYKRDVENQIKLRESGAFL
ncbi:hypothetical protein NHG32_02410 [Aerococcaceae bacterium NML191219]|nr:hypothetical protein [Aerococcaceae bacterium NML191219]